MAEVGDPPSVKTVTFAEAETNAGNALVSLCIPTFHQYVPLYSYYSYISPVSPLGFMIFIMCPNGLMFFTNGFMNFTLWTHGLIILTHVDTWIHAFHPVSTFIHKFHL